MLKLKNGTEVRIIKELDHVVVVEAVESQGYDLAGRHMFQRYNLSKKNHKGLLLLDGVIIL